MSSDGEIVPMDPSAVVTVMRNTSQSWISIDVTGLRTVLDVDKYAIMHRVQIHARDLRILDPNLSYPSTILGRDRAIVLNLEHIKAIITSEEVLLRDSTNENVIPVLEEFQRRLPVLQIDAETGEEYEFPFEFRALEVALEAICNFLAARTAELETSAYTMLDELTSKISGRNLDKVRKLKNAITLLTARVQKVRDALEQLLDDDDDMAELYLTRKLAGVSDEPLWYPTSPTIGSKIVEELEMLLEAYFMQIDSTLNNLTTLREYIDDTEDYINIQVDDHRNRLIQLELVLSAGTVCLSVLSLITALLGMNIPHKWNDDHGYMFKWVTSFTVTFCAILFVMILAYARFKGLIGS